jgi:hypothetical protein
MAFFKRSSTQQAPLPLPPLEVRLCAWQAENERLRALVKKAREFRGLTGKEIDRVPVALRPGERVYAIIVGARLMEPRSTGGSGHGVAVRIPGSKSMRDRVGATKGSDVRVADSPTEVDAGTAVITDKRVAFAGSKQSREWQWAQCLGVRHQADVTSAAIAVSSQQRTSGIAYDAETTGDLRFRLELAYAVATGEDDDLIAELEGEFAAHQARRPGAPLPPPQPV